MSADIAIDRVSLLADVAGAVKLHVLEERLRRDGLTLGASFDPETTVGAWLAEGAPGTRDTWLDPADHVVAGLEATLHDGRALSIRPAPRRAVGPDLIALVAGMRGRFARVDRAWLRVHPIDEARPSTAAYDGPRNVDVNDGEARLLDAIEAALRNP